MGDENLYVYASNPAAWIDPFGLCPIGFAKGTGETAFTPDRLQHASRHLTDAGLLPNWSKKTGELFKSIGADILENPTHTFDHKVGQDMVKGFGGVINGQKWHFLFIKLDPDKEQLRQQLYPLHNK